MRLKERRIFAVLLAILKVYVTSPVRVAVFPIDGAVCTIGQEERRVV
jgi:hypothetical protein